MTRSMSSALYSRGKYRLSTSLFMVTLPGCPFYLEEKEQEERILTILIEEIRRNRG